LAIACTCLAMRLGIVTLCRTAFSDLAIPNILHHLAPQCTALALWLPSQVAAQFGVLSCRERHNHNS
jgi:hypothetical protein